MSRSKIATRKSTPKADQANSPETTRSEPERLWNSLLPRESIVVSISVLMAVVLLTFRSVSNFDFTNWDDGLHTYANPFFKDYSLADIDHFWRHAYGGLYVPLSYTVFGLLIVIAHQPQDFARLTSIGVPLNPAVFHIFNLFLHTLNVVLVFLLLRRMIRKDLPSLFGALLFAVHPLQVESVAWISELRGLLGAAFSLAALHLYLTYVFLKEQGKTAAYVTAYVAALLASACAMLSKPSYVVIGIIIAAIAVWSCRRTLKTAVLEAAPFFPFGLVVLAITSVVQSEPSQQMLKAWQCPFIAGDASAFYLWKFLLPIDLLADYSWKPKWILSHWWGYANWVFPISVAFLCYRMRIVRPYLAFGATIAIGAILPVLGLAPFVYESISTTADRYVYLSMLGIAIVVAFGFAAVPVTKRQLVGTLLAIWLACLSLLSFRQTQVWQNSGSLFSHVLSVNPRSAIAQANLGAFLEQRGQIAGAERHYLSAYYMDPTSKVFQTNLGGAYAELGDERDAERLFRIATVMHPNYAVAHRDLGILLMTEHQSAEGVHELTTALSLDPAESLSAQWLGEYFEKSSNYPAAFAVFTRCLSHRQNDEVLWRKLGLAFYASGRRSDAVKPLETALQIDPSDEVARSALQSISNVNE